MRKTIRPSIVLMFHSQALTQADVVAAQEKYPKVNMQYRLAMGEVRNKGDLRENFDAVIGEVPTMYKERAIAAKKPVREVTIKEIVEGTMQDFAYDEKGNIIADGSADLLGDGVAGRMSADNIPSPSETTLNPVVAPPLNEISGP